MLPKPTTVATATATCSGRPRTTGSVAITAAAPQIELPAPIRIAVRRSRPNTRVPRTQASAKVLHNTVASITTPAMPTWPMSWNVRRRPYSTMPARSRRCLATCRPSAEVVWALSGNRLPTTSPMTIASVRAEMPFACSQARWPVAIAAVATAAASSRPGTRRRTVEGAEKGAAAEVTAGSVGMRMRCRGL